jgi:DNA-directed RNA polymerase subunit A"
MELPLSIRKEIERRIKNKEKLDEVTKKVYEEYKRMMYTPEEPIGVITAQSLSEPATQMSLDYNEKILIKREGVVEPIEIGRFVDELMEKFPHVKENESEILDIPNHINIFVYSLDQDEKLKLKRIRSVIRHKSPRKLLKIKTASGRKIVATDHHSFVIRYNNTIIPISGKQLKIGDRIPVMKFLPENCLSEIRINPYVVHSECLTDTLQLDSLFGEFIGAYLSEGNSTRYFVSMNECDNFRGFSKGHEMHINSSLLSKFLRETCGTGSKNKKIPKFAFSANEEFVSALLRSYFDGDGSINVNRKMIIVHSNSEELVDGIKLLLTRFGIFANKHIDKKQFYLTIPYRYAPIFLEKIGSNILEKRRKLEKLAKLAERFWNSRSQDFIDEINGFGDIFYQIAEKLGLPKRYVNNFTKRQKIGRTTLHRYIKLFEKISKEKNVNISTELAVLRRMFDSDVLWDRVDEITYIKARSPYVYDISVDGLETFTTFDGIITHNTMRTYHFAGTAGIQVTLGLPRLIEIFDAKKEPETPTMTIYLEKGYQSKEKAKAIAEDIKELKLRNFVISDVIDLINLTIKCNLDVKKMKSYGIDTKEIVKHIKLKNVDIKTKDDELIVISKKTDNVNLHKLKYRLLESHIKGVRGILQAVVSKENDEWVITTLGSNLKKVLEIEGVDKTRTTCNNPFEICEVLGIEAARNAIIKEAVDTIEEQGLGVNIRYVILLADLMTFNGKIMGIGRYGIAGNKESVLARMAFEETKKHVIEAGITGLRDPMKGPIENIIVNQVIPMGTGAFTLIGKIGKKNDKK